MVKDQMRNWQIVLYALSIEGGVTRHVHTEDVATRCHALAADAFSWIKYRQYPDKEVVRRDLIRLRDGKFGAAFVVGRTGKLKTKDGEKTADGWQLTPEGARWIAANEARVRERLGDRQPRYDRQQLLRSLARIRSSELFREFLDDPEGFAPRIGALAELLRCRVDAEDRVWCKRFETLRNQAEVSKQEDVLGFAERCESLLPALK